MLMLLMTGGLGNQMFQYALYRSLTNLGKTVYMDDFTHYAEIGRNDNCLEDIFHIKYLHGNRKIYNSLTDSSMMPWMRIKRKIFGRKPFIYQEKNPLIFEKEVFEQDNKYLSGYWQSYEYFADIENQIRSDFTFDCNKFSEKAREYIKQIEESMSVSLHVRRGDYLSAKFSNVYGGICTESYYEAAKDYCRNKYGKVIFFLFTNDSEWGMQQNDTDVVYVDCKNEDADYIDMALMSKCKHHIIANSSFSWWGAWLDDRKDKTVIAPSRWLNIASGNSIYESLCNVLIDEEGNIL